MSSARAERWHPPAAHRGFSLAGFLTAVFASCGAVRDFPEGCWGSGGLGTSGLCRWPRLRDVRARGAGGGGGAGAAGRVRKPPGLAAGGRDAGARGRRVKPGSAARSSSGTSLSPRASRRTFAARFLLSSGAGMTAGLSSQDPAAPPERS